jgi:hypothetical protein
MPRLPKNVANKSPDMLRATVQEVADATPTDLSDLTDRTLKLTRHALNCLETEMLGGMGYKALTLDDKCLGKLQRLAATVNSLNEAQVRLFKAEDARVSKMTKPQKLAEIRKTILSLPRSELVDWLNKTNELATAIIRSKPRTAFRQAAAQDDLPPDEDPPECPPSDPPDPTPTTTPTGDASGPTGPTPSSAADTLE